MPLDDGELEEDEEEKVEKKVIKFDMNGEDEEE
jgi:hypothetical protein